MTPARTVLAVLVAAAALAPASCGGGSGGPQDSSRTDLLGSVTTWAYQIQGLDQPGAVDALAASTYQMLVLEPTRTSQGSEAFDAAGMVQRLQRLPNGGRRLVLAYVDIGEAEDYRTYWLPAWRAPTATQAGDPDFLLTVDPDGWSGNYPVAYWDQPWKSIVYARRGSLLDLALQDGFDGIYMDWVEAYDDDAVLARAAQEGVDPAAAMIRFIQELRQAARRRDAEFLVIAQNAPDLATGHPEYLQVIDAIAQEDVHFRGEADTAWGDPESGDIRTPNGPGEWTRQWLYSRLDVYRKAALPVFTVDYALILADTQESYRLSRQHGYVPFVSQTPLSRLP